ncbi:hypothetical protein [Sinosporangium siamense]|uniref:Uncharacterized protein n=1 Tax=Sinosporangium siamense TaxID=1367973 RepID=A0A919RJE0_9ACTN|nr:hypothetical protein [Sinosporangium siamense]GII94945.1 hypothetical protein Ssi02_51760 [Sinosporangium siamense]
MAPCGSLKPLVSERLCFDDVAKAVVRVAADDSVGRLVFMPDTFGVRQAAYNTACRTTGLQKSPAAARK